jgi:hypothetical protein
MDRLRSNPKVHIVHNADDFLAERKSIEGLKEALGDQMTLYPYGGHLGNLWYPENKKSALRFFRADSKMASFLDDPEPPQRAEWTNVATPTRLPLARQ